MCYESDKYTGKSDNNRLYAGTGIYERNSS